MLFNRMPRTPQRAVLGLAIALAGTGVIDGIVARAAADAPITEPEAVRAALEKSPILEARRREVEQARARLTTARTYPFNPELAVEAGRRTGDGTSTVDRSIELSQDIRLGGQRRVDTERAQAALESAESRFRREERLHAARVRPAFVEALRARDLAEVERANVELARRLLEVARRRLESGAATQIELNFALAQAGRDERSVHLAEAAYAAARAVLAEVIGADPGDAPLPVGELALPKRELPPLGELLDSAVRNRADLKAFRDAVRAAEKARELARREVVPDLRLSAFYTREEATDRIAGLGIGLRIPVFNRNQGRIAEAEAVRLQFLAESRASEITIRQEVASALSFYRSAAAAARNLQQSVLGALNQNLRLLQRSLEAGKIGWTEVLVFRREFVNARRDFVETLADARLAAIQLELASGAPLAPAFEKESPR